MWLITNLDNQADLGQPTFRKQNYSLFTDSSIKLSRSCATQWFCQGDVLLRNSAPDAARKTTISDSVDWLISEGGDFIQHFKGNHVIAALYDDGFEVYGDRFGVLKWFIWQQDKQFIITDSLDLLRQITKPEASPEGIAVYALTYHFSSGMTLFEGIKHNIPAQYVRFTENTLITGTYWDPLELLTRPRQDVNIKQITDLLSEHILRLLELHPQVRISLSLTGGADTRNLLALMLSQGIRPHLYTYGNPLSNDCVKAGIIAKSLGLEHQIHDVRMSKDIFADYARHIIRWGQSLSSIHRVHRIIAVEREAEYADTMFLGTLGGEFVKGVSEDDYIVPSIIYEHWTQPTLSESTLLTWLEMKCLNADQLDLAKLLNIMNREAYFTGSPVQKKLATLAGITAHLHDAQDINLYLRPMKHVFTPFLDIDYLEILFSSSYSFNNKEEIKGHIRRRIQNPVYCSRFIRTAFPALGKFRYSGEHVPNEVLLNPYYAALMKGFRKKTGKLYPPNLPQDGWMDEFVRSELPGCMDSTVIGKIFRLDSLTADLNAQAFIPQESYWLRYSNPIMMKYILNIIG